MSLVFASPSEAGTLVRRSHNIATYPLVGRLLINTLLLQLKIIPTCEGHTAFWVEAAIKTLLVPLRAALLAY